MRLYDADGKETNAGGGHIDLSGEALHKAVEKNAGFPGSVQDAAGMGPGKEVPAEKYRSLHTQPQTPRPESGDTMSHTSDG